MREGPCSSCSNSAAQGIEEASHQSTDSARHSETIHNDNIICVKSGRLQDERLTSNITLFMYVNERSVARIKRYSNKRYREGSHLLIPENESHRNPTRDRYFPLIDYEPRTSCIQQSRTLRPDLVRRVTADLLSSDTCIKPSATKRLAQT